MFIYAQTLLRGISRYFASSQYSWSGKRGISLVAVVIVMMIVASLALFIASSMSSGNIAAITDMQAEQAFYIAQAGMEWYLEQLQGDNNWNSAPAVKTNQVFGSGTFSVTFSNNSRNAIDIVGIGRLMRGMGILSSAL
jgi:type II secretory pathway pseudopilin PulG